jgi:hypothetical protein
MVIDTVALRLPGRTLAAACACSLLLAGCAASPTPQPTTNPPTVAPVFASDEEALAAATEAYANYLRVADTIVREGGEDASRISEYVSDDLAVSELEAFAEFRRKKLRGVGETSYSNFTLQRNSSDPAEEGFISAYVCSDLTNTDVIDESGQSVVSPGRVRKTPYEVTFGLAKEEPPTLVVSSVEIWRGDGICI